MKRLLLYLLIISTVSISGCWNYKETNKFTLVTGVAIDYDENNDYLLTIEVMSHEEGRYVGEVYSMSGITVFDAIRNFINITGEKIYWGHSKSVVISKDIAWDGLIPVFDFIYRDAELRKNMWVFISGEDQAGDVFESSEEKIKPVKAYHMEDILKSYKYNSKYFGIPFWRAVKDIYSSDEAPVLPVVFISKHNNTFGVEVGGSAVLKDDRLTGFLDEDQTKVFLLITGEIKGGLFKIPPSSKGERDCGVTLEVLKSKSTITSEILDGRPKVNVNIKLTVNIAEVDGTCDVVEKKGREKLEEDARQFLISQSKDLIKKMQGEFKSDIFGFCKFVKDQQPGYWREVESMREEIFEDMDCEINVDMVIRGSALEYRPIKIK